MRRLGVAHDTFTFPIVNQAVSSLLSDVIYGLMVHCLSTKMGFRFDVYVCNAMNQEKENQLVKFNVISIPFYPRKFNTLSVYFMCHTFF